MNLSELITKYGAPLLGAVIGGPAGLVATTIGQVVASQFGGDITQPEQLAAKIQADPEAANKLAQIESDNKVKLQSIAMHISENSLKYEAQRMDLANQNTKNARETNTQTKSLIPPLLSVMVTIGFFATFWLVLNYHFDPVVQQILNILVGGELAAFSCVLNYWLGTSASSARKDEFISKLK